MGCGKTTLCRRLLNEIDGSHWGTALILNPRINETEMLKAILRELGETPEGDGLQDFIVQMQSVLLARISSGRAIVLIIDEAQNLSFEVLEQIRLISNLETDKQKLRQIVLMGQPELKDILALQLRQRILVHYELKPLTRDDVVHYITHRLTLAGGGGPSFFTGWAARRIHGYSGGIPRIVNNVCDKALLASYVRESDEVTYWDVRRAIKDVKRLIF
ncbi:MAG: AAA family ATPase [Candidatus Synoicihabitans palmerolidicus]|nr:AAA family ATPase [Candidatus Synoicihabitans palmerolidicus]